MENLGKAGVRKAGEDGHSLGNSGDADTQTPIAGVKMAPCRTQVDEVYSA